MQGKAFTPGDDTPLVDDDDINIDDEADSAIQVGQQLQGNETPSNNIENRSKHRVSRNRRNRRTYHERVPSPSTYKQIASEMLEVQREKQKKIAAKAAELKAAEDAREQEEERKHQMRREKVKRDKEIAERKRKEAELKKKKEEEERKRKKAAERQKMLNARSFQNPQNFHYGSHINQYGYGAHCSCITRRWQWRSRDRRATGAGPPSSRPSTRRQPRRQSRPARSTAGARWRRAAARPTRARCAARRRAP